MIKGKTDAETIKNLFNHMGDKKEMLKISIDYKDLNIGIKTTPQLLGNVTTIEAFSIRVMRKLLFSLAQKIDEQTGEE